MTYLNSDGTLKPYTTNDSTNKPASTIPWNEHIEDEFEGCPNRAYYFMHRFRFLTASDYKLLNIYYKNGYLYSRSLRFIDTGEIYMTTIQMGLYGTTYQYSEPAPSNITNSNHSTYQDLLYYALSDPMMFNIRKSKDELQGVKYINSSGRIYPSEDGFYASTRTGRNVFYQVDDKLIYRSWDRDRLTVDRELSTGDTSIFPVFNETTVPIYKYNYNSSICVVSNVDPTLINKIIIIAYHPIIGKYTYIPIKATDSFRITGFGFDSDDYTGSEMRLHIFDNYEYKTLILDPFGQTYTVRKDYTIANRRGVDILCIEDGSKLLVTDVDYNELTTAHGENYADRYSVHTNDGTTYNACESALTDTGRRILYMNGFLITTSSTAYRIRTSEYGVISGGIFGFDINTDNYLSFPSSHYEDPYTGDNTSFCAEDIERPLDILDVQLEDISSTSLDIQIDLNFNLFEGYEFEPKFIKMISANSTLSSIFPATFSVTSITKGGISNNFIYPENILPTSSYDKVIFFTNNEEIWRHDPIIIEAGKLKVHSNPANGFDLTYVEYDIVKNAEKSYDDNVVCLDGNYFLFKYRDSYIPQEDLPSLGSREQAFDNISFVKESTTCISWEAGRSKVYTQDSTDFLFKLNTNLPTLHHSSVTSDGVSVDLLYVDTWYEDECYAIFHSSTYSRYLLVKYNIISGSVTILNNDIFSEIGNNFYTMDFKFNYTGHDSIVVYSKHINHDTLSAILYINTTDGIVTETQELNCQDVADNIVTFEQYVYGYKEEKQRTYLISDYLDIGHLDETGIIDKRYWGRAITIESETINGLHNLGDYYIPAIPIPDIETVGEPVIRYGDTTGSFTGGTEDIVVPDEQYSYWEGTNIKMDINIENPGSLVVDSDYMMVVELVAFTMQWESEGYPLPVERTIDVQFIPISSASDIPSQIVFTPKAYPVKGENNKFPTASGEIELWKVGGHDTFENQMFGLDAPSFIGMNFKVLNTMSATESSTIGNGVLRLNDPDDLSTVNNRRPIVAYYGGFDVFNLNDSAEQHSIALHQWHDDNLPTTPNTHVIQTAANFRNDINNELFNQNSDGIDSVLSDMRSYLYDYYPYSDYTDN